MTMREEAKQAEKDKHRRRALFLNVFFFGLALMLLAFLLVMATHWPRLLVEEEDLRGTWSVTMETEWDIISIAHGLDLSGNTTIAWSITRGHDNETVEDGVQTGSDDYLIIVGLEKEGEYTLHLDPEGRNDAKPYDVRVREHYISPGTVSVMYMFAAFVLAFVVGVTYIVVLYPNRRKNYQDYKMVWWVAGPFLGSSAIGVLLIPWM